jgi:hypothetical protein
VTPTSTDLSHVYATYTWPSRPWHPSIGDLDYSGPSSASQLENTKYTEASCIDASVSGVTSSVTDKPMPCGDLVAHCDSPSLPMIKQNCPTSCGECVRTSTNVRINEVGLRSPAAEFVTLLCSPPSHLVLMRQSNLKCSS